MRAWTALRHGCHYRGFVALLPAAVASTWGALAISRAGSCSVGGHRGVCAVFNCMSWGTGKRRGWGDTERELRQWGQQPWLEHAQIGAVQPEPSQLSPAPALSSGESSPCARGGGVSGLIDNILMVAKTTKLHQAPTEEAPKAAVRPVFPKDGGLPEDAVADALGLLPDSSFTRMLRYNGRSPAWFTQRPDHKSD